MSSIDEVVASLTGPTRALRDAAELIPAKAGLYAWWTRRGSIPAVPICPHPMEPQLDLFYVGISPSRAASSATIRSRVTGNHMRGNTGGSTFRLSLASLLFGEAGWEPVMSDRPLLSKEDNRALSAWQHENLRLTWAVHPEPWAIEHEVITRLGPPLNIQGSAHEFRATVSAARRRFKEAAGLDRRQSKTSNPSVAPDLETRDQPARREPTPMRTGRTQPVTAADKRAGQIRIPSSGMTKNLFPSDKTDLQIRLLGHDVNARWNPRTGPDKERSGVIGLRGDDKKILGGVPDETVLTVTRDADGEIAIK